MKALAIILALALGGCSYDDAAAFGRAADSAARGYYGRPPYQQDVLYPMPPRTQTTVFVP